VAAEKAAELQRAARKKPLLLSAVSGAGVRDVLLRLGKIVHQPKEVAEAPAAPWEPELAG
jgi:GTP-binding protein